jgi:hypothetical protein
MRWAEHVAYVRKKRSVCRVFAGKPEGKRTLRRLIFRWEFNIKMNNREIGLIGATNWMYLAQNRDILRALVNMIIYLRVQQNFRKSFRC